MRGMSDKSLRLVLSTFSNIREELGHLQNDLTVTFILIFLSKDFLVPSFVT